MKHVTIKRLFAVGAIVAALSLALSGCTWTINFGTPSTSTPKSTSTPAPKHKESAKSKLIALEKALSGQLSPNPSATLVPAKDWYTLWDGTKIVEQTIEAVPGTTANTRVGGKDGKVASDDVALPFVSKTNAVKQFTEAEQEFYTDSEFLSVGLNYFANQTVDGVKLDKVKLWLKPFAGNPNTVIAKEAAALAPDLQKHHVPWNKTVQKAVKAAGLKRLDLANKLVNMLSNFKLLSGKDVKQASTFYYRLAGGGVLTYKKTGMPIVEIESKIPDTKPAVQLALTRKIGTCYFKFGFNTQGKEIEQFPNCTTPPPTTVVFHPRCVPTASNNYCKPFVGCVEADHTKPVTGHWKWDASKCNWVKIPCGCNSVSPPGTTPGPVDTPEPTPTPTPSQGSGGSDDNGGGSTSNNNQPPSNPGGSGEPGDG